jgi:hypothetical protein
MGTEVMVGVPRTVGLLIMLLALSAPAHAQAHKAEPRPPLGWDGRPVTHSCHADTGDLEGFKATLIEHEKARIGFKNKIRHGVFSGGELSGGRIRDAAPNSLVEMITRHLSGLADAGEAVALIYDVGLWRRHYALCTWLISSKGIEAALTVPIAEHSPFRSISAAATVRSGLDVEGRAAARAPQPRLGHVQEIRPSERASDQLTDEAWSLLMPAPFASKLRRSSAKRLLILPAADIGFVPFAALPLDGGRLIDRLALVLLPDVEALLGLASDVPAWREHELRSIIVGDPDLAQDRRWQFPPLPGARFEAMEVAALVGAQPLLGAEATKRHVLDALMAGGNANLIYFATHALSDAVNPMDGSFLALAGDHLYGRDIKSLMFSNNPIVVMSACQTGLGKVFAGGGFGLVRAWYHVGALQIIMSLWNIDDSATGDLMLRFMHRVKSGAMAEFALRDAMLAARQTYADPALWASMALFGLPSKASGALGRPRLALQRDPPVPVPAHPSVAIEPSGPAQRVMLIEEDAHDPRGRRLEGSVVWGTAPAAGTDGPERELRGQITIPERKATIAWSLRRNSDPALPASHVLQLTFAVPPEMCGGGVQSVPGVLVKARQEARGKPAEALSVRLAGGDFLLGLLAGSAQANATLLKEGSWLDIPLVYEDGRRAILTIEKGSAGDRAFEEAFAAWSARP